MYGHGVGRQPRRDSLPSLLPRAQNSLVRCSGTASSLRRLGHQGAIGDRRAAAHRRAPPDRATCPPRRSRRGARPARAAALAGRASRARRTRSVRRCPRTDAGWAPAAASLRATSRGVDRADRRPPAAHRAPKARVRTGRIHGWCAPAMAAERWVGPRASACGRRVAARRRRAYPSARRSCRRRRTRHRRSSRWESPRNGLTSSLSCRRSSECASRLLRTSVAPLASSVRNLSSRHRRGTPSAIAHCVNSPSEIRPRSKSCTPGDTGSTLRRISSISDNPKRPSAGSAPRASQQSFSSSRSRNSAAVTPKSIVCQAPFHGSCGSGPKPGGGVRCRVAAS